MDRTLVLQAPLSKTSAIILLGIVVVNLLCSSLPPTVVLLGRTPSLRLSDGAPENYCVVCVAEAIHQWSSVFMLLPCPSFQKPRG